MSEQLLVILAGIVVLGVGAQWLAWRLGLPSIILLLAAGFVVGPITGVIDPDAALGELLFPLVSISVAIILFEGGLSLRLNELRGTGNTVWALVSVGALVTWAICSVGAIVLLGFPPALAVLLGAILIVTGPTVVGPLLRVVRPSPDINGVLKWEGILIDPIGAALAVIVFEAVIAGEAREATLVILQAVILTIFAGVVFGALGAGFLILVLRRYWVPDYLQNAVALMAVVAVFAMADTLQEDSGLLAVTIMGVVLGNQRRVSMSKILAFKEDLRVLLIAALFIILTARLQIEQLVDLGVNGLLYLALVVVLSRPLAVLLATVRSNLDWNEKAFLAWMAPRGIVAASVSSVFALRMEEAGFPDAERLVPATFLVIVGTVLIYSLSAVPVGKALRISRPEPQGVLIVGAHLLARQIGSAIKAQGFDVLLVDTNPINSVQARTAGLAVYQGNVLDEELRNEVSLTSIGRILALTPNDEVNTLAALEWLEAFGRSSVYQLVPGTHVDQPEGSSQPHVRGRPLFSDGMSYHYLMGRIGTDAQVTTRPYRDGMRPKTSAERNGSNNADFIPMFVVTADNDLIILTDEVPLPIRDARVVIGLAPI